LSVKHRPTDRQTKRQTNRDRASGGSRKNIWGAWPFIIWEATIAEQNYVLHRPTNVLFYIDVGMRIKVSAQSKKKTGGLGKIWGEGLCPPDPNIELPLDRKHCLSVSGKQSTGNNDNNQ